MLRVNKLWVKIFCKEVGVDKFCNRYFIGKSKNYLGKNKRYVVYNGLDESSKVPPGWHAWLHYLVDEVPGEKQQEKYSWQIAHIPNLTGTKYAYKAVASRAIKKQYDSWSPNNQGEY